MRKQQSFKPQGKLHRQGSHFNEELIVQTMLLEPILMQRPIVIIGDKAIIGRPPENVLALKKQVI